MASLSSTPHLAYKRKRINKSYAVKSTLDGLGNGHIEKWAIEYARTLTTLRQK